MSRILNRKTKEKNNQQLEEIIDTDKDIQIFQQNQLNLLNPKVLYNTNSKSQLYRHYREEQLSVLGKNSVSLPLINAESIKEIKLVKKDLMHIGLIVIGIKGLTRKNLGTKTLITIYDNRWSDIKKAIIGLTEVDMTNNGGISYISSNFMMNLNEFGNKIRIGIQTKGYEKMHSGKNLLMCVGFLGKMTDNSNTRFKLQIKDVVEVMENKGIKLIKPIKISPEEYAGLEWKLGDFKEKEALIPNDHLIYTNSKGEPSIRFTDYNYEA